MNPHPLKLNSRFINKLRNLHKLFEETPGLLKGLEINKKAPTLERLGLEISHSPPSPSKGLKEFQVRQVS